MPSIVKNTFLSLLLLTPLMFGAVYSWGVAILEVGVLSLSGTWVWCSNKKNEVFSWREYRGIIFLFIFLAIILLQLPPWPDFILKFLAPGKPSGLEQA